VKCPLCIDAVLDVTHHGGIEIDVCPRCRGVWLDRGELDRLAAETVRDRDDRGGRDRPYERDDRDVRDGRRPDKARKKRRLADRLSDVFEEVLEF
jgi:Zn-finger nucleic acid-binding protein